MNFAFQWKKCKVQKEHMGWEIILSPSLENIMCSTYYNTLIIVTIITTNNFLLINFFAVSWLEKLTAFK